MKKFLLTLILILLVLGLYFLHKSYEVPPISSSFNEEQAKLQLTKYFQQYFDRFKLSEEVEDISIEKDTSQWFGTPIGHRRESKAAIGLKSGNGIETYFSYDAIEALADNEKLPLWSFPPNSGASKRYPLAAIHNLTNCVSSDNECHPTEWGKELHCEPIIRQDLGERSINWDLPWFSSVVCSCKESGPTVVLKELPVNSCEKCLPPSSDNIHTQCVDNVCERRTSYKLHGCALNLDIKLEKTSQGKLNIRIISPLKFSNVLIKKPKDKMCSINLTTDLNMDENLFSTECEYKDNDNCVQLYKDEILVKEIDCLHPK